MFPPFNRLDVTLLQDSDLAGVPGKVIIHLPARNAHTMAYALAGIVDLSDVNGYKERDEYYDLAIRNAEYWASVLASVTVSICQEVIECVQDNDAVMQAIISRLGEFSEFWSLVTNSTNTNRIETIIAENTTTLGQLIEPPPVDCNDRLFAMCRQFVVTLNDDLQTLFDAIELASNVAEGGAILAQAISVPIVGTVSSATLEFTNFVQESIQEAYNLAWDDSARDTIACLLFCAVKDTCELSLIKIIETLENYVGSEIFSWTTAQNIWDLMTAMTATVTLPTGSNLIIAMFWGMLQAVKLGTVGWYSFTGKTFPYTQYLVTRLASFQNDKDPDWQVLCSECQSEPFQDLTFDDPSLYSLLSLTGSAVSTNPSAGNPAPSAQGVRTGVSVTADVVVRTLEYDAQTLTTVTLDTYIQTTMPNVALSVTISAETSPNVYTSVFFSGSLTQAKNTWVTRSFNIPTSQYTRLQIRVASTHGAGNYTTTLRVDNITFSA